MQGDDDVIEEELQAIHACYPDVPVQVNKDAQTVSIRVPICPRYVEEHESFVKMTLELRVYPDYPSTAADVVVGEFKGLDSQLESVIEDKLREQALRMKGDMVLGHLIETGFDLMDEYNTPHGTCVFCLEHIAASSSPEDVVKLPCYHCFHRSCFTKWYVWKQHAIRSRAEELVQEHNMNQSMIDKAMEDEGIEKCDTQYVFPCPCCRIRCNPATVAMQIGDAREGADDEGVEEEDKSVAALPAAVRELVYKEQARFSTILSIQKKNNCINSR